MFKKLNKKGFTLAELLVVVAIIGVLVAISIPIFTSQLEKAREATDMANLRAAYAECSTSVLTQEASSTEVKAGTDGAYYKDVTMTQQTKGWVGDNGNIKIGNTALSTIADSTKAVRITVSKTGTVTFGDVK